MYWLRDHGRRAKNEIQDMETRTTRIEAQANSAFNALFFPGKCNSFSPKAATEIPHMLTGQMAVLSNTSLSGWCTLKIYLEST